MKKSLALISIIFLTSLASAYYGGYSDFSLGNILDRVDASTMVLGAFFIILFALLNFSLSKFFRDQYGNPNKAIAGVISFAFSLLAIYGIHRSGFDYQGIFYNFTGNLGIPSDLLYTIIPLLLLALIIFLGFKWGWRNALLVLGIFFFALGFFAYESGTAWFIAGIFFIIWLVLLMIGKGDRVTRRVNRGRGVRVIPIKFRN